MTPAAKSIYYFSFYLFINCAGLILAPNVLIGLLGLPATNEVWVRVVGLLAGVIGVYYFVSAKHNYVPIFKATVYTRVGVLIFAIMAVLLKWSSLPLIGFGLVDFLGALWTYFSLKKS